MLSWSQHEPIVREREGEVGCKVENKPSLKKKKLKSQIGSLSFALETEKESESFSFTAAIVWELSCKVLAQ